MNISLSPYAPIRTKLNPPQYLQAAMSRPRLLSCFQQIRSSKIIKIIAPPGYGKSTYLSQLRQHLVQNQPKLCVPWLNLDADDNDPITMTEYLCAAFNQYNSKVGERSLHILKSGSLRSLKELYVALVEDLQQSQHRWAFFVDDFHVLEKSESSKLWQWFVEHLPPNVMLVLASRKTLPLQLKKLQLHEDIHFVSAEELQFDPHETHRFFTDYKHQALSAELLKLIQEKTEGWVGALQMLSLSLHQTSNIQGLVEHFSGEHKDMMEYLSEVVLEQLPADIKDFMLKISVLDRVCAEIATQLSEEPNAQNKLEEIERRNLFLIPLDNEKRWYRFHHLFQEFLRRLALKNLGEKLFQEKYCSASLWFQQEAYHHEAIQYALTGKDYTRAAELISQFALQLVQNQGDHRTMQHWMKQLPKEYLATFPIIKISYIFSLIFTHSYVEAKIELEKLKTYIYSKPLDSFSEALLPSIELNECLLNIFQDKILIARQHAHQWLQKWPKPEIFSLGIALSILGVSHFSSSCLDTGSESLRQAAVLLKEHQVYYAYAWASGCQAAIHESHGQLSKASELYEKNLFEINRYLGNNFSLEKLIQVMTVNIDYERGDFEKATMLLEGKKIYIYSFSSTEPNIIYYAVQIRIEMLRQQFFKSMELLKEAEKWAKELEYDRFQNQMFLLKIELFLQTKHIQEAKNLLEECHWSNPIELVDEIEDTNTMISNIFGRLALSRILMAEKKFLEAKSRLKTLITLLEKIGLIRHLLSAKILEILCEENLQQQENAIELLQKVLELAAAEGFVSVFLEHGAAFNHQLLGLLKKTESINSKAYELRNKILRQLENYHEQTQKDRHQGIAMLDQISSRELQILSALDSEKSNVQIAKSLHISLGTLKWHLHNIYQKLDVKNRSGALLKAKQLELI